MNKMGKSGAKKPSKYTLCVGITIACIIMQIFIYEYLISSFLMKTNTLSIDIIILYIDMILIYCIYDV